MNVSVSFASVPEEILEQAPSNSIATWMTKWIGSASVNPSGIMFDQLDILL